MLFKIQSLPSTIGVDIVICDHQKEQEHSQHIWENGQLDIGYHAATKRNTHTHHKGKQNLAIISLKKKQCSMWISQ